MFAFCTTYKNSRILFSFFSGGLRPPHPPDKSAFGLPRRVRNSWYHGTMVPWYHGSVVGMVPMVPMVHVVAWYRGTMVPMVWGYHGTRYHLTWFCVFFQTFIKTDGFGSLTENDVTGGADLVGYFLDFIYGIKGRFWRKLPKSNFWAPSGVEKN